jgi:hypothetical protein
MATDPETVLMDALGSVQAANYHIYGAIPSDKLVNAHQYLGVPATETILALIDTTMVGNCKTGLAITPAGLFWRNDWTASEKQGTAKWEELVESAMPIKRKMFDLVLGGDKVVTMSASQLSGEKTEQLLNKLIALYCSQGIATPSLLPRAQSSQIDGAAGQPANDSAGGRSEPGAFVSVVMWFFAAGLGIAGIIIGARLGAVVATEFLLSNLEQLELATVGLAQTFGLVGEDALWSTGAGRKALLGMVIGGFAGYHAARMITNAITRALGLPRYDG